MTADDPLSNPAWPDDDAARTAAAAGLLLLEQTFDADSLYLLRAAALAHATAAGMPDYRAADVMLAVHELAANAVRHGGGTARLSMYAAPGAWRCQVDDADAVDRDGSAHGREGGRAGDDSAWPWPYRKGHGLWLVREVADQLSVARWRDGSRVTAVFVLPATEADVCTAEGREQL
jgi:anti-sigma regulatory factor (Ser/Thr protein kinase)